MNHIHRHERIYRRPESQSRDCRQRSGAGAECVGQDAHATVTNQVHGSRSHPVVFHEVGTAAECQSSGTSTDLVVKCRCQRTAYDPGHKPDALGSLPHSEGVQATLERDRDLSPGREAASGHGRVSTLLCQKVIHPNLIKV